MRGIRKLPSLHSDDEGVTAERTVGGFGVRLKLNYGSLEEASVNVSRLRQHSKRGNSVGLPVKNKEITEIHGRLGEASVAYS